MHRLHSGRLFGLLVFFLTAAWLAAPPARADDGPGGDADGRRNVAAEKLLPEGDGLAAAFPADVNIASHKDVIFADDFEASDYATKWDDRSDKAGALALVDLSAESPRLGRRTLQVTARLKKNNGGNLTKWFEPAETVYVRFYVKFDPQCDYIHHFCMLRANKSWQGGDRWSGFGGAGERPKGDERFSTAIEPWGNWGKTPPPGKWHFYSYWHTMHASNDGKYWGNTFDPAGAQPIERGRWICVEFMLKHNTPGKDDGEHAFWIDGQLLGHWRDVNWRRDPKLFANAFTLESYVTDAWTKQETNIVYFDDVVIAKSYIGPSPETAAAEATAKPEATGASGRLGELLGPAGASARPAAQPATPRPSATEPPLQGFGATTTGGDSLAVVEVTTLADSGAGSLREALKGGARRIVFRVGGTIELAAPLTLTQGRVTLDGRTAPAPGITLRRQPFVIQGACDVIVRHLRFRESADDNLRLSGECANVVIDHCSSSGAGDGAMDITLDYKSGQRPHDVTISWCLLAGTAKAMLVQSVSNLSLHHNLFSGNDQRSPQLHEVTSFDLRCNLVRGWLAYGCRVRAGSTGNAVANVFEASRNPGKRGDAALVLEGENGPLYFQGNVGPGGFAPDQLGTAARALAAPAVEATATGELAAVLYRGVGARPLDKIDQEFLGEAAGAKSER